MKQRIRISFSFKKVILNLILLIFLCLPSFGEGYHAKSGRVLFPIYCVTSLTNVMQRNINLLRGQLYYPQSVARFYKQSGYRLAWIAPDTVKMHADDAMLLLDCILQYGLSHADYHPDKLSYDELDDLNKNFSQSGDDQKARFDILLTDAMLRLINDLHYGKLNSKHTGKINDADTQTPFLAVKVLAMACRTNNFIAVIESAQPKSADYAALKHWMYLVEGVYTGDCYETPESTVRQVAINMERLRWAGDDEATFIHINIPSYVLQLHQKNKDYFYRVQVGKRETPTAQLQSKITSVGAITGKPVDVIADHPPLILEKTIQSGNPIFDIYDHVGNSIDPTPANLRMAKQNPANYVIKKTYDYTPEQTRIFFHLYPITAIGITGTTGNSISSHARMATKGNILVERAEMLVYNILQQDGSGHERLLFRNTKNNSQNIRLKKAVPIHVTYLTCAMKDGVLETYKDIYALDISLAQAFYHIQSAN